MFYIVEFKSSKEVAVIPSIWESNGVCQWPSHFKTERLQKAVRRAETPEANWTLFNVRIMLRAETFELARSKLKLAEEMSDLQTETEEEVTRKRKSKPNRRFSSSESSESEDEELGVTAGSKKNKTTRVVLPEAPRPPSPPALINIPTSPEPPKMNSPYNKGTEEILKELLVGQKQILDMQKQHSLMFNQVIAQGMVTSAGNATAELPENVNNNLPVKEMEVLDEIEARLMAEPELKKTLIAHLGLIGGSDTKETVWRILTNLIHNSLAKRINWSGVNGKRSFKGLTLAKVVAAGVRKNPLTKTSACGEIEANVKRWFQLAGDRDGGRRAREKQNNSNATNEV